MASNFEIGVKFGAEGVPEVSKSITQLNAQLQRFREGLNTAVGVDSIARLNKAIDATQQKIKAIQAFKGLAPNFSTSVNNAATTLNSQFTPAVGRANLALLNVGRIAQDAPFGFIGIANNIEPLIQSFQALRKESGSTGGVLQALGKSLIGPGGLLLGVSAVSFVMSGGVDSIKKFFASFSDANKNITDAKKFIAEIKSVGDIRLEASGSVAGEIAEVQALAEVVRDETLAKEQRLNAIQRLKQINKSYFGDLSLEKASLDGLTKAQEEYSKAIITQAVIKSFGDELGRVAVELYKQQKALDASTEKFNKLGGAAAISARAQQAAANATKFGGGDFGGAIKGLKDLGQAQDEVTQGQTVVKELSDKYKELSEGMNAAVRSATQLKSLDTTGGSKQEVDVLAKRLAALEKVRDVQEELTKELPQIKLPAPEVEGLSPEQVRELTGEKSIAESFKRVDDLVETSQKIYDLKVQIALRDAEKNGLSKEEVADLIQSYRKQLEDAFNLQAESREATVRVKPSLIFEKADTTPEEITSQVAKSTGLDKRIPITTEFEVDAKLFGLDFANAQAELKARIERFRNEINKTVGELQSGAFQSIGEGLGNVLGGGGLQDLVSPIINRIGDALIQFGKAAIEAGIKFKALKLALKALEKNPALSIVVGIAAVAAGTALKKKFSNTPLPKFKEGGVADGPLSGYNVELHGRELIVPIGQLSGQPTFSSRDTGSTFIPSLQFSGDMFKIMLNKVNGRRRRV